MNRKEQLELLEALENMYLLVGQASPDAFKNGVTGDFGTPDQGDYYAGMIMSQARDILRNLGVEGIG